MKQMNKQEAIELLQEMAKESSKITKIHAVYIDSIVEVINQIDEPQKVVVPKFVAEWIEEAREEEYSLYGAWEMVKEGSEIFWWLFDGHESNQDTFARAWLDGYEVETEKLYTVEIPDPNSIWKYTFLTNRGPGVSIDRTDDDFWKDDSKNQFTEAEIKQDFEWAFQFAKPVEEK